MSDTDKDKIIALLRAEVKAWRDKGVQAERGCVLEVSMELKEDMAVVWRCCDNHYVGVVPCVIVAITEKRVKVAVLLANGKIDTRYADKKDLGSIDMHEIESILLNVRCGLGLKKIKEQS